MASLAIRPAVKNDCPAIYKLMEDSLKYEQNTRCLKLDIETLEEDGFGRDPFFKCIVAELPNSSGEVKNTVGYALYFYIYSTWEGKALFLEDLFVESNYRQKNVGKSLLKTLVQDGLNNGCCRVDCHLKEGRINFMKKLGFIDLTETEDWHVFTLSKEAMLNFN